MKAVPCIRTNGGRAVTIIEAIAIGSARRARAAAIAIGLSAVERAVLAGRLTDARLARAAKAVRVDKARVKRWTWAA